MGKHFLGRATEKQDFTDWEIGEWLNFYGVVKDNQSLAVENAVVMVFACFTGGIEKPQGYTFTDKDGRYFISIPKLPDNHDLTGFKVRASKPHIPSKAFDFPVYYEKEQQKENGHTSESGMGTHLRIRKGDTPSAEECPQYMNVPDGMSPIEELKPDTVQCSVKKCEPGQDEIANEVTFSIPAENHAVELINSGKAGESEYYQQPPEGVIFVEPDQASVLNDLLVVPNQEPVKKVENVYKKNEFNSTTLFYSYLAACSVFLMLTKK